MKRLVVCCDGTWNAPPTGRAASSKPPTNVFKFANGVAPDDADGNPQRIHYQAGVGTRRHEHLPGGLFGFGLSQNIRECYRFVVDEYESGDAIYVVGFSRGAFTGRSLAGLIRNAGILRREHAGRVGDAYRLYRSLDPGANPNGIDARRFRRRYSHPAPTGHLIHFVGVWDTVGALGIPGAPAWLARGRWAFHDTSLSRHVGNAFHAVAIDERRSFYSPTLWTRDAPDPEQTFEQAWFPGAHTDVGGGNPHPALAEIPLLWIVERARGCGLRFSPGHLRRDPGAAEDDPERASGRRTNADPLGVQQDSPTGRHRLFPSGPRSLADEDGRRRAMLASTALLRDRTHWYDLPRDAFGLPVLETGLTLSAELDTQADETSA